MFGKNLTFFDLLDVERTCTCEFSLSVVQEPKHGMSKFVLHKMDKVRWHAIVSFYAIFVSFLVQGVRASEGPSLWQLLSIAPISGFVGYITNVLALKMTFFPVEFFGIKLLLLKNQPFGLFGWQGCVS